MDPPLPLNTLQPSPRPSPRRSPREPPGGSGGRVGRAPADMNAVVPPPSQPRHGDDYDNNLVPPPPIVVNHASVDLGVPMPEDEYDDAISLSPYDHIGPSQRHFQRKGTKKGDSHYLKLSDVGDQEKSDHLMRSILSRDFSAVARDIKDNPSLAGITDLQGISALEKIVVNGNLETVECFVRACKGATQVLGVLDHATLYAIRENNLPMVQHLLKMKDRFQRASNKDGDVSCLTTMERSENSHMQGAVNGRQSPEVPNARFSTLGKVLINFKAKKKKSSLPGHLGKDSWAKRQEMIFEDAEFSSFITPIVLAAKLNRLDIVRYLIVSDNCEIHPLTVPCPFEGEGDCELCSESGLRASRTVEDSMRRIEMYRALASPAFIFSTTEDPVLEAFWISQAMRRMQTKDPAFKKEYEEINVSVRGFATELLNLCRSSLEIRTMLAEKKDIKEINTEGEKTDYPRILLALYFDQKEFVAHPHCQQTMNQVWSSGIFECVRNAPGCSLRNLSYILGWLILWPLLCLLFIFKVSPKLIGFMKIPYNRLISDNISFAIFLALLLANAIVGQDSGEVRGEMFSITEFLIIAWVAGMTARLLKMAYRFRTMFKASSRTITKRLKWKWYHPAILTKWRWYDTLMLLCFWLWIVLRAVAIIDVKHVSKDPTPRYLWPNEDVTLFGEAFYAIGVLLSVIRLNSLVLVSHSLGPMQISLKRMVGDIVRFIVIFLIVMSAFALAISKLYGSYEGSVTYASDGTILEEQQNTFIGFQKTYKNLFWALFEYPDVLTGGMIVVNNTRVNSTQQGDYVKHDFTEFFGLFLIGAYHCIALIILLNMLIAMMANSYNTIERNADMEWKFAHTRLRMMYIIEVGSLPPPFNMNIIGTIIQWLQKCCSSNACCKKWTYKPKEAKNCNYKELIPRLYNRYWNQQQKSKHSTKEDLQRLLEQYGGTSQVSSTQIPVSLPPTSLA